MHKKNIHTSGKDISEAKKVLIMIHGRGGNAQDILSLSGHLNVKDFALFAPQATGNTWYPYSFLAEPEKNEPQLSSAIDLLDELLKNIKSEGISSENIFILGFSQGACLTLEFAARNAQKFGGIVAFTGGLIGDRLNTESYSGDFNSSQVFISTGDPDPHVPVERVQETEKLYKELNANVTVKIYNNRPHTISQEEIDLANQLVFK